MSLIEDQLSQLITRYYDEIAAADAVFTAARLAAQARFDTARAEAIAADEAAKQATEEPA